MASGNGLPKRASFSARSRSVFGGSSKAADLTRAPHWRGWAALLRLTHRAQKSRVRFPDESEISRSHPRLQFISVVGRLGSMCRTIDQAARVRSGPGTFLKYAERPLVQGAPDIPKRRRTSPPEPLRTFADGIAAGNAPRPTWPSGSLVGKTAQSGKPRLHQLSEVRFSLSYCLQRTGPAWSTGLVCDDELVSLPFA
jgi:hypothetical protein